MFIIKWNTILRLENTTSGEQYFLACNTSEYEKQKYLKGVAIEQCYNRITCYTSLEVQIITQIQPEKKFIYRISSTLKEELNGNSNPVIKTWKIRK